MEKATGCSIRCRGAVRFAGVEGICRTLEGILEIA